MDAVVSLFERVEPFIYQFKPTGGAAAGCHCTYCPKSQGEQCVLGCTKEYERIQAERAADGVVVKDH